MIYFMIYFISLCIIKTTPASSTTKSANLLNFNGWHFSFLKSLHKNSTKLPKLNGKTKKVANLI